MSGEEATFQHLLDTLQERAKELNCLYRVDEILGNADRAPADVCRDLVEALPAGWKYPAICCARIALLGDTAATANWSETPWGIAAPIVADGETVGRLSVHYLEERPPADEGPFLKEERKLFDTVVERIGFFVTRHKLRRIHHAVGGRNAEERGEWAVVLEFLRSTDPDLLRRITRRMINRLDLAGVEEAEELLHRWIAGSADGAGPGDDNVPLRRTTLQDLVPLSEETFGIAARKLGEEEMVACIRGWIDEDRSGFLVEALEDPHSALPEIVDAIERHRSTIGDTSRLARPLRRMISVALLRRLFTDDGRYVSIARNFVELEDVYDLVRRIVYPMQGRGKLGGKSAGLFLASRILRKAGETSELLRDIRLPKTWYVSSDGLPEFLSYNNLKELYYRKYMSIEQVRQEYPHIVHLLKNSHFPPEISRGLALVLDDLQDRPLVVRSSSLLEDRTGSSFAGKYKSLFLANRGTREERLAALQDAIAEVYASIFSPDPIEYRADRGLLDVSEEMAIMIQEVVGRRVGHYWLPAFSGVAFSHNEFRWSERIRREDGLLRMVPGLGTRAVDRLGDDYPVLLAPGQPSLRVNVSPDEVARYSPRWIDVIDLETNRFETVELRAFLRENGERYPAIRQIVSVLDENRVRRPTGLGPDFAHDDLVVTFDGLIGGTPFVRQMAAVLDAVRETLGKPVDVEFASDGEHLYLVQCRTQSYSDYFAPEPIPRELPRDSILFYARRNISNGRVPPLTHVVYVDPAAYYNLQDARALRDVGRAVGRLNTLLPKRQFVLLGPGRWGSRGDIKLGVRVTYADISNAAVLMEIAHKKGSYVPELSFGTHFFQDLVESDIRYIPLYPEDSQGYLNEPFLRHARNMLPDVLPEYAGLADALRVIDVGRETGGRVLRVLLNADLDEGVGLFDVPRAVTATSREPSRTLDRPSDHWRWRLQMVERIAAELDPLRFGVKALYLFGSVKNATAGPNSDIDLLVHDEGPDARRAELELWLDGWGRALSEMNFLRTGYHSENLLDVHFVTDRDIEARTSWATKIDAVTDPARRLALGG